MQHLVTFKGIWDFDICIALRNLFKNLWSVISDRLSTGEELLWLWERFSHWAVYFQMRSSESQDSEMVYGKQMSSCLCDSIFPLSYILPKRSAWLPRLLFAFWTNQLPSTLRSASSFGDEVVQKLLPRDMSSIQENTKAYWALKSSHCSFEKKSIEYSALSEYLWSAYDFLLFFFLAFSFLARSSFLFRIVHLSLGRLTVLVMAALVLCVLLGRKLSEFISCFDPSKYMGLQAVWDVSWVLFL